MAMSDLTWRETNFLLCVYGLFVNGDFCFELLNNNSFCFTTMCRLNNESPENTAKSNKHLNFSEHFYTNVTVLLVTDATSVHAHAHGLHM